MTVYLNFSSVDILIDQHTLFFIFRFFKVFKIQDEVNKELNTSNNNNKKNETLNETKDVNNEKSGNALMNKIIIKKIFIEEFLVNFCYNTHKLVLQNNKNKEFLEILNLTDLKDLKVLFRQHISENSIILSDIFDELLQYWKEDIKNNQIISSFISSISCLKPFKNIVESFFEIFRLPYYYHINNESISEGTTKGFILFFINISSESINIGEKVYHFLK